jgi:hypothetical protein
LEVVSEVFVRGVEVDIGKGGVLPGLERLSEVVGEKVKDVKREVKGKANGKKEQRLKAVS